MTVYADAFIDESGQRSLTLKSSDHFVMGAVIVMPHRLERASELLADMRKELGRQPHHVLSWKKLKSHSKRLHAATRLGGARFLRISAVVVCKRDFAPGRGAIPDEDFAYLYTFRFLLERLSWLARQLGVTMRYTLSQIGQFPIEKLRDYESKLRAIETSIDWAHLDAKGGRIDQPNRVEHLQLADIATSATAAAFEPDDFGKTERRYLEEMRSRFYRHASGPLTSYGLKMHPWTQKSQEEHAWLLDWE